ncbi:MAG TPA: GGDEF domain-containing protein [Candidatus Dormibacteraeota bacterium]|nr:GGDEF domain-containing protein [Candidatus Dormibacteraeota bacterium]
MDVTRPAGTEGEGDEAEVARAVIAAWLSVPPTALASVGDDLAEAMARRIVRLPEGAASSDAEVTTAILGDLIRELHRRATTDPLTGLLTRGAIEQRLIAELSRAERYGRHVAVLLVDVDGLKAVNDAHGHGAGDAVLRSLARRLDASVRTTDVVGRWGGDEFLIICPEATEEAAAAVASKIVTVAQGVSIRGTDGAGGARVSVGWAVAAGGGPPDVIVGRADAALYEAKQAGGDRALGYGPQVSEAPDRVRGRRSAR